MSVYGIRKHYVKFNISFSVHVLGNDSVCYTDNNLILYLLHVFICSFGLFWGFVDYRKHSEDHHIHG